jgi:hypothetical protein
MTEHRADLPPDVDADAGPALVALLSPAILEARRGPDELTRARHLRAITAEARAAHAARSHLGRGARTAVAAAAAGVVVLAGAGALPAPAQQVAASVASRLGVELPLLPRVVDRADRPHAPTGPTPVAEPDGPPSPGPEERATPSPTSDAPPTGAPAPAVERGGPDVPVAPPASPPAIGPGALDAWERLPGWLDLRRDGRLPAPARPDEPLARSPAARSAPVPSRGGDGPAPADRGARPETRSAPNPRPEAPAAEARPPARGPAPARGPVPPRGPAAEDAGPAGPGDAGRPAPRPSVHSP